MYFTFNKKNVILWGCILAVFFDYKCMSALALASKGPELRYTGWLTCLGITLLFYKDVIRISQKYLYARNFMLYILFSQIIICAYSMMTYEENFIDMFICAGGYIHMLFMFLLFIGMEEYGTERFLNYFIVFALIYMAIMFVNALTVNYMGFRILSEQSTSKTANFRASLGTLYIVVMIVSFWKIIIKEEIKKYLAIGLFGIFMELYVQQTRMYELGLLLSFFFMWLFHRRKTEKKIIQVAITVVFVGVFLGLGLHHEIINSFSIDYSVNKNATSSIARLNAIYYFKDYLFNNPMIGMGWVRPKNDYLKLIFSGPRQSAFFDDLGFLGQVFRQGILGAIIYLLFVIRLLYITIKLPKNSKYKMLVLGIVIFILFSAISLNCFDGQRILGTAFLFAIAEKTYNLEKNI